MTPASMPVSRIMVVALLAGALALTPANPAHACTAFCAIDGQGRVLVGNNEDYNNPRTKIRFVPAEPGKYGRMYVGFDDLWPQGGMNERGLWFDGFAAPAVKATGSSDLPHFPGNIIDKAMAECTTVEEVMQLFGQYNRAFLTQAILMFADAAGDAVSIEPDAMVRKTGRHFVQTNFHQSRQRSELDGRFLTASSMLEHAGANISIDLFRRILSATHQEGDFPTVYSNVYDLTSRTMYLYHFRDFEHAVTFTLADELAKGERILDIPSLFPRNAAADAYAARRPDPSGPPLWAFTALIVALPILAIAAAVITWMRAGRSVRIGVTVVGAGVVLCVAAIAVMLSIHHRSSSQWMHFSIGPAAGDSAAIQPGQIRANGITLETALAVAYDIPGVRIIGPSWLNDTRYSIHAMVGLDDEDSFRSMLQEELRSRLQLETHREVRPFEVFVLRASRAARLDSSRTKRVNVTIHQRDAMLQDATMTNLASALESILARPVLDETAIEGSYNLSFEWGDDRVASVTAALRDRFGLELSPARREMEALIVDRIQRDPALVLLDRLGRATRAAPPHVRQRIADILRIR
jgi:uncharacterized protein (TIGR03435 family)